MKFFQFVLISSLLFLSACTKQKNKRVVKDCDRLGEVEVLTQKEKENACIYNNVYRLNGEIYTTCVCCVCGKFPMAIDCDGQALCDLTEDCMLTFFEDAEYLFSVEGEL